MQMYEQHVPHRGRGNNLIDTDKFSSGETTGIYTLDVSGIIEKFNVYVRDRPIIRTVFTILSSFQHVPHRGRGNNLIDTDKFSSGETTGIYTLDVSGIIEKFNVYVRDRPIIRTVFTILSSFHPHPPILSNMQSSL